MKNGFTFHKAGHFFGVVLLTNLIWINAYAQGSHFDTYPTKTKHKLTFSKHVSSTFDASRIPNILKLGSEILQKCDNATDDDQDISCEVSFEQSGSTSVFGVAGDNLEIITTDEQLTRVHAQAGFVKVVTALMLDGKHQTGIVKAIPSSSMILAQDANGSGRSDAQYAQTLVHEFGHNQGLCHRNTSCGYDSVGHPVMGIFAGSLFREINKAECKAYHDGFNVGDNSEKNRPADIVFVIDDTGSMGEEINGVKNAIIKILSTYSTSASCNAKVFQLVTFKDNFTKRDPTSDLSVIRNQVSALVASGGGACPEASVEALEATDDLVKDGGIVYLATDASPHPGLTTANAASRFAKRGVRAYVLLSGDCSSAADSRTVADYEAKYGAKVPFSGNQDSDEKSERSETAKEQSAIEAFSFLAQETKGVFAFVPEVNTRRSEDVARYENIAFNIIQGAIGNAISFIEPSKAPGGSTVLLTITGTNTNFNAGSSLVFDETGVTFGTPTILSSSKITVSATIPAGTPLGLKNITVTTPLADGSTEMSKGTGLFEVIAAPTTPTILGITPPTGSVGQALTVTINGINTNFTNESVPNLGSGITIGSVQAKSSTELVAAVTIAPDATIGYRDVRVTTGSEVATENVTGPFLVTEAGCTPIVIPSVVISASSVATLTASGCSGSLLWSTGETTGSITVGPLISSTVISATCTTGACVVTASGTITVMPAIGGAFALIAPTYDCATGAFRFNTTGGDGSAITYWAVGITGPTTNPNDDVDAQLAQDIRDGRPNIAPLTLYAQQSGMMVSYTWNALAACSSSTTTPPSTTGCGSPSGTIGQPLVLVAPTYNCSTGVIQFNTSGGNGSPIEFMAIGITGWTTNCIDNLDPGNTDNNTYTIMARQNGMTVSLAWTRPCASLRVARETGSGLNISVLGNPTTADRVEVELRGAEGQAVRLQVIDSNGRSVSDLQIEQAAVSERRTVPLGRTAGIYFIKASTTTEAKTVKVVKQ